jgi:hypothetical protein
MSIVSSDRQTVAVSHPSRQQFTIGTHVLVLERTDNGGLLKLASSDGSQPLEIEITPAGAVLRLGTGLAITVAGNLALNGETLSIHANKHLALSSDGGLDIRVAGDMSSQAEAHIIAARLGDVKLEANDDVVLRGERIKMNC